MPELQQEGNFRGNVVQYSLDKKDSGAVMLYIKVLIDEVFHEGDFRSWEHEMTVTGNLCVVKRDGKANIKQVESLVSHLDWNGSFESLINQSWKPARINCSVREETYEGKTYYRIAWINEYESRPKSSGNTGNIDTSKAKELDVRLGGVLRGIVSNLKRKENVPPEPPSKEPSHTSGYDSGSIPF